MTEWQPIETAPKDGTNIILCQGARVTAGEWYSDRGDEDRDGWEGWMSQDGGFADDDPPEYWMPLPAPPSDSKEPIAAKNRK